MTVDQLEAFVAVSEAGGLRAASKVLHKTQPTISVSIKNLEEELGLTLFNRESYRVKLTEEGNALLERAKEILFQFEQFQLMAKEMNMGREPYLNLAIDYFCPLDFLFNILTNFKESCSFTKIDLDFEVLGGAEEKVLSGLSNLAITPFFKRTKNIEYIKIVDVKIIPVIRKELLKKSKNKLKSISNIPQIIVKDSSSGNSRLDFNKSENTQSWTVSDHMVKRELICKGLGWGHLEQTSIKKELKNKQLVELNEDNIKSKSIPLYLIRSKSYPFGPATGEIWQYIISEFKKFKK